MDEVGDRIALLLRMKGWSQGELARRVGVSQQTIWKLVSGHTQATRYLHQIARALDASPDFLLGLTSDVTAGLSEADAAERLAAPLREFHGAEPDPSAMPGMVMVTEVDLALGLGGTFVDGPVETRQIPFPADWLRQFSDAPAELLHFVRGKGDSMYPTIMDGDICLLDRSRQRIDEQDALWAVSYGDLGMIKRLRSMPDGTVKIMSDNQNVREEIATDGELFIWARCCGVIRKT
jgi:phage repressor protein C with HTH and peptisase S24 domain